MIPNRLELEGAFDVEVDSGTIVLPESMTMLTDEELASLERSPDVVIAAGVVGDEVVMVSILGTIFTLPANGTKEAFPSARGKIVLFDGTPLRSGPLLRVAKDTYRSVKPW